MRIDNNNNNNSNNTNTKQVLTFYRDVQRRVCSISALGSTVLSVFVSSVKCRTPYHLPRNPPKHSDNYRYKECFIIQNLLTFL